MSNEFEVVESLGRPVITIVRRREIDGDVIHRNVHRQLLATASQYVLDEASVGDPALAAERLRLLDEIPLLPLDSQIGVIADEIVSRAILPPKAALDALHIAAVAHHRIEYLLTWNCRHIANARILPRIRDVLTDLGIPHPIICTPEEMVDDESEEE